MLNRITKRHLDVFTSFAVMTAASCLMFGYWESYWLFAIGNISAAALAWKVGLRYSFYMNIYLFITSLIGLWNNVL